ncbi:MAG: sodium:proline symporter [Synechococcus sp. MED-G133]|jgi:SSS family solute:Na+ symporter|uniref:sodium:solute symporter family protein n=1 Tax=Synechococcus sp. A15-28 TaxID=1050638 RepID=UPI0012264C2B|nr:sodium:solute symporter family protein [Synechococcus sp. A15-28]MBA4733451.1 Na+:solute symporter [Synechococcus sp.]QNI41668.1 sodium:solute symporter family/ possibly glucose transporter [Synechococcus sp. A15-28]RZO07814.1 MAG: sodium:proline symporter [Synechococcus sp. MED-G133]|tara:strand:- start:991 stop:2754 length:1764 start_codon:yes stop_codon:yes gene_type:complete
MAPIDWALLGAYLVLTLVLGLWLARRNSGEEDYFVAGRRLSGWLAGASMAATTFSIDTPLYVAGLIGSRGLAGNWEWWSFGLAHVAMAVVFAPLWRRSGVLTDAAFTELRYGGSAAAWLRGVKAFLLALPVNCIGIGYAFLALRKVVEALGIVTGAPAAFGVPDTLWLLAVVALMVLAYTVAGGLWAVVVTDLVQLVLALLGALAVAIAALHAAGGMGGLLDQLEGMNRPELLSLVPWSIEDGGVHWLEGAGISVPMFLAYIAIQWWSFRRSDGGGEFIQRMLATRDEQQARLAGWVFLVVNYLVRSWLWVVVALAALVLLPDQGDWELSYPALAVQLLPPVALGLVVVSLVAAFMSTVSTSVNWGASYLTHDLYQRFIRPRAGSGELLLVGQLTTVLLLMLGVVTALISDSIGTVFRLVIAIGSGPGVVLVLRWFWWRVNAAAELAAMLCGFVVGLLTSVLPVVRIEDYGLRLAVITGVSAVVWLSAMLLTPPESEAVLETFIRKVQPPGPGWARLRQRFQVEPQESLSTLLARFVWSCGVLFGGLIGIGGFLLHQQFNGWGGLAVLVGSWLLLRRLPQQNGARIV